MGRRGTQGETQWDGEGREKTGDVETQRTKTQRNEEEGCTINPSPVHLPVGEIWGQEG